jgi:hypothetical protein
MMATDHIAVQAGRLIDAYLLMRSGRITPESVAEVVEPFSPQALLCKIWRDHRKSHGLPT